MSDHDPITRHFFNGFIRLHILHHAAQERICGAEITEELVRHGYKLSQGTLYPTLHQLEQLGYLRSQRATEGGRWRTYYRATAAGKKVLKTARARLQELVAEVLEGQDTGFSKIRSQRAKGS
jgi:PadR family transcriptional regulator PadR